MAFIDGFYHALDKYDRGKDDLDKARYRKYKWLCLTSLIQRFISPETETLVGVKYFTTYPTWNAAKRFRHTIFVRAQVQMGAHVTFGEFKEKKLSCRADCRKDFSMNEEKQTDINIAIAMIDCAPQYDKLILLTADSDQVPALKLLDRLYPEKIRASLPPIGRKSKEIVNVCNGGKFQMTEQHLIECQLADPFPLFRDGKQYAQLNKPQEWKI